MKASELRIGNSIMQDDDLVFVTWWRLELMENNKIEYKPIPLTEEWLIEFRFRKNKYDIRYWYYHGFKVKFNSKREITFRVSGVWYKIKYVHQLQNLYFALTGEELTIKDEVY
jgi:hypothetical protein